MIFFFSRYFLFLNLYFLSKFWIFILFLRISITLTRRKIFYRELKVWIVVNYIIILKLKNIYFLYWPYGGYFRYLLHPLYWFIMTTVSLYYLIRQLISNFFLIYFILAKILNSLCFILFFVWFVKARFTFVKKSVALRLTFIRPERF